MNDTLQRALEKLKTDGPTPRALATLTRFLDSRLEEPDGHLEAAEVCEELGVAGMAFREILIGARFAPNDPRILRRLATGFVERGEADRAAAAWERLLAVDPLDREALTELASLYRELGLVDKVLDVVQRAVAAGLPDEEAADLRRSVREDGLEEEFPPEPELAALAPTSEDLVRYQRLFQGREEIHARQWWNDRQGRGGYAPVKEPLTPALIGNHILGNMTLGVYPLRLDGTVSFLAIDVDIRRAAIEEARADPERIRALRRAAHREAVRIRGELANLGLPSLLEDSGYKGRHLWILLGQPEPGESAFLLARLLHRWLSEGAPAALQIECFPKQARRKGKGLGNLIKLPLGIHRRSGRRSCFLHDDDREVEDPFALLRAVPRVPQADLHCAISRVKRLSPPPPVGGDVAAEPPPDGLEELEQDAEADEGPAAPEVPPAWTEADFELDPDVARLLTGCPVLAELKKRVDEHRRLDNDEQLVLIHTLGHRPAGCQAVNYLFQRCVDVAPERYLKTPLSGNPISCPKIRKRVPRITSRLPCNCAFPLAPDRYPTPVLHLLEEPFCTRRPDNREAEESSEERTHESLARRYGQLLRRSVDLEGQLDRLRQQLMSKLRGLPEMHLHIEGGSFRLRVAEGLEELVWEPDGDEAVRAEDPGTGEAECDRGSAGGHGSLPER